MAAVVQRGPQALGALARHLRCFSSAAAQGDVVDEMIEYARKNFKVWLEACCNTFAGWPVGTLPAVYPQAACTHAHSSRAMSGCRSAHPCSRCHPTLPNRATTSRQSMC